MHALPFPMTSSNSFSSSLKSPFLGGAIALLSTKNNSQLFVVSRRLTIPLRSQHQYGAFPFAQEAPARQPRSVPCSVQRSVRSSSSNSARPGWFHGNFLFQLQPLFTALRKGGGREVVGKRLKPFAEKSRDGGDFFFNVALTLRLVMHGAQISRFTGGKAMGFRNSAAETISPPLIYYSAHPQDSGLQWYGRAAAGPEAGSSVCQGLSFSSPLSVAAAAVASSLLLLLRPEQLSQER